MADLEAVLADVSYLMAMERSKAPAAKTIKKIALPDARLAKASFTRKLSSSLLASDIVKVHVGVTTWLVIVVLVLMNRGCRKSVHLWWVYCYSHWILAVHRLLNMYIAPTK